MDRHDKTDTSQELSASTTLKARLRADLREAMVSRDLAVVRVLRTAIAALDAAEAVDAPGAPATIGRSGDVARRHLTQAEATATLAGEIAERRRASETYRQIGKTDAAEALEREVHMLTRYLPPAPERPRTS